MHLRCLRACALRYLPGPATPGRSSLRLQALIDRYSILAGKRARYYLVKLPRMGGVVSLPFRDQRVYRLPFEVNPAAGPIHTYCLLGDYLPGVDFT